MEIIMCILIVIIFVLISITYKLKQEVKRNEEVFNIIANNISEKELEILRKYYGIMI